MTWTEIAAMDEALAFGLVERIADNEGKASSSLAALKTLLGRR